MPNQALQPTALRAAAELEALAGPAPPRPRRLFGRLDAEKLLAVGKEAALGVE